jgi:hypothetical protein
MYKKNLKKFAKLASDKKNESIIDRLSRLETSAPEVLNLSRRKLKELNLSRGESEKIKIPSIDVDEIIKHHRRTLNKSRNTTFIKNESVRADATFTTNKSVSKSDSNSNEENATFTVERDFVTPDNDTPLMELKRKQIEEELNRSVTMRKPRTFQNREGTPVVGETSTESLVMTQSPSNKKPQPKRLAELRKEFYEASIDDSESSIELQTVAPIRITFDDLHSDDSIDSEDENLDIYPRWSKYAKTLGEIQSRTNPDLIDTFFCQEIAVEPKEIFPNTSAFKLRRRRSSIMWNELEN